MAGVGIAYELVATVADELVDLGMCGALAVTGGMFPGGVGRRNL